MYHREVTAKSDHIPLEAVIKNPIHATKPRLQRLFLRLLKFNIYNVYCPGNKMQILSNARKRASVSVQELSDAELQEDIELIANSLVQSFHATPSWLDEFCSNTISYYCCYVYCNPY